MSGSRLGRGRVGRLALISGAAVCALLLVYFYRSTSAEMTRIRDLHVECAQQQEALATKFQVLYEYRVKLENALSNEKSANAAAKEELQQKASRERSLRDKDSLEAMQRFNSMQQNYKQLQAEQQDLKEDCKNKEGAALENAKKLESTLQDLRIQLKKAEQDKESSMEHLKIKYTELISEKEQLEEKYNNLKKSVDEDTGLVERLQKQIIQLQRELVESKNSPHFSVGGLNIEHSQLQPRHANAEILDNNNDMDKPAALENNQIPLIRTSSKQQVSRPSNELEAGQNPQPLQAPENNRHLDDVNRNHDNNDNKDNNNNNNNFVNNNDNSHVDNKNDDTFPNEIKSDVRFENRNGNIVPVGPNDMQVDQYGALPIPLSYEHQANEKLSKTKQENPEADVEQAKQVLAPPNDAGSPGDAKKEAVNVLSSKGPIMVPILKPQDTGQQLGQVDSEQNILARDPNDFE